MEPSAAAPAPQSGFTKFAQFPLTRIIIGLFACVGSATLVQWAVNKVLVRLVIPADLRMFALSLIAAAFVLVAYVFLYTYYERRSIGEFSFEGFLRNAGYGTLLGAGLQSAVILCLYAAGYYSIVSVNGLRSIVPVLGIAIGSGVIEETIFRGIIFRITEEKLGSVFALVITSVLFGLGHIFNPNATLYSAFAIAVEAGILLGAAYMVTRNLWLPIFLHFAWNLTESGIFGAALSGNAITTSLITCRMTGPELITGGQFGPENSIIAVVLCTAAGLTILFRARQKNMFIEPFWRRQRTTQATASGTNINNPS